MMLPVSALTFRKMKDWPAGRCYLPAGTGATGYFLTGELNGAVVAVFLDGDHRFHYFAVADAQSYRGLEVDRIDLLVDPATAEDDDRREHSTGCVSIKGGAVYLHAKPERGHGWGPVGIRIFGDEPAPDERETTFTHWSIVRLDAQSKLQTLFAWPEAASTPSP